MTETTIHVQGMTCDHCVRAVTGELSTVPGVTGVAIELSTGAVRIQSDAPLDDAVVRAAVDEAGYEVAP